VHAVASDFRALGIGRGDVYPKEIEEVLYAHPAVLEAAVVGRPHDVYGEEPVADRTDASFGSWRHLSRISTQRSRSPLFDGGQAVW